MSVTGILWAFESSARWTVNKSEQVYMPQTACEITMKIWDKLPAILKICAGLSVQVGEDD